MGISTARVMSERRGGGGASATRSVGVGLLAEKLLSSSFRFVLRSTAEGNVYKIVRVIH